MPAVTASSPGEKTAVAFNTGTGRTPRMPAHLNGETIMDSTETQSTQSNPPASQASTCESGCHCGSSCQCNQTCTCPTWD